MVKKNLITCLILLLTTINCTHAFLGIRTRTTVTLCTKSGFIISTKLLTKQWYTTYYSSHCAQVQALQKLICDGSNVSTVIQWGLHKKLFSQIEIDRLFGASIAYKNKPIINLLIDHIDYSNQDLKQIAQAAHNNEIISIMTQKERSN